MPRILIAGNANLISPESKILFDAKGYQLIHCGDLHAAVAVILENPPDLLIVEHDFDNGRDRDLITSAKACLQKTNIPILLVLNQNMVSALDWDSYPIDDMIIKPFGTEVLIARVMLAESRLIRVFDNNPLSRLPGNTSIIRAISKIIDSGGDYGVCYVDIDNFKPYNDRYGFTQGDDIILMVARIIVNVVEELARKDSFIGHVGGDDYVFIIKEDKIKPVCEKIIANFDVVRSMFLTPKDLKAGGYVEKDRQGRETRFGLLSLSIAVVTTGGNKFKHYGEVSATASQMKHHVKKMEGSNYLIDRRNSYS